jgi:PAS domain S-box-containing protein
MSEKPTYAELEQRVRELEQAESERKRMDEANQNTSELLSFFIKHSPIYAFLKKVSATDSRVLYASDNYVEMIGIPASQMIGKTMDELFPLEFAEKITRDDIDVVQKGIYLKLHEELNGRIYVTYKFPLKQGGDKYLAGYTVDVTDLKKAEGDLAQIFSMSLDMICIADINTATFIKVNPAFTEILGYSEEELLEKPFSDFIHPEDIDATRIVVEQKLQMGFKVINFENRYRCKDGNYRWLSWVSHPNTEKGVTYSVARDITDLKLNEEALKNSKALLDATGRMARVGGWELDADTMEVTWTEETYRIHEAPLDHKPPLREAINFFHPEDRPQLELAINHALDHGEPYDMEIRFITAQGNHLWVRTICQPEIINGKVVRLLGTFQDITNRRRVEEALKESKTFLENITDVAYMADDQGNVLWVNPAAERVTGLPPEDITGKPFLPLFIEADYPFIIDVYKRTLAGESLENMFTFKSGVTCRFTSLPKRNQHGDIVGIFGVARDISDRLSAERALQTSEARLKKAQAMAKVGNWEYDIATGKVWGSEEAFRIYGIERTSEFLPPDIVESYMIDAERVNQAIVDLIAQKETYDIEFQIQLKTREGLIHVHSMADLVCDEDGKPVKVVGVIQDITENKRSEKEREELEGKLRQAQKMEAVGRLAGGVAHDFNNMLTVIIGHANLAIEDVDPSLPLYTKLEEIRNAGERSADLTNQLLSFARKQTISPRVIDLNKTVKDMTSMLQRLIGEDIDLAWLPGDKVWPVKMDPSQINQILANFCVNSRDAITDVGKITIETGNAVFDETYCADHPGFIPGEYVLLAISDNGCGMDAETLDNIFEPYFTTKEFGKGTGLGLATVYGVVKQNNGFISVYSEPNQGTTFKVYLPRYRSKADFLPEKAKDLPAERGHETILLVEDEAAILKMTTMMLERLGYQVLAARTPGEAIRFAQEYVGKIHLLVTDVVMPEMNGRDLAKNILSTHPNLKRLFMSGYTANVIAHHGVLDEGVNFIQKPFSREKLGFKLREVLDGDKK